jgi:formylglycine-generating enzyme required for sulfatase activity
MVKSRRLNSVGGEKVRAVLAFFVAGLLIVSLSGCRAARSGARVDYSSAKAAVASSSEGKDSPLNSSCPVGMLLIPAGPANYGPTDEKEKLAADSEGPQRLNMKSFCIDRYEFPNQPGESPMRSVSWLEARNLCGTKGKRLCSEYEFEKACRGPGGTRYTYGDGYFEGACPKASQEYGLGQFSNCISGFGVNDMSGGVYEWTSSGAGENSEVKYLRGGMAEDNPGVTSRCTYRAKLNANSSGRETGFRCCAAVQKEELAK